MACDVGRRALVPLPRAFFERPLLQVARALLGQLLVREGPRGLLRVGRIVEAEAYGGVGVDDSAHSFRGPTPRCATMFGPPGRAYVYLTQGGYHCLNVTAEGGDSGRAVLLRAFEPLAGIEGVRCRRLAHLDDGPTRRRLLLGAVHELAAGPGRLCLGLDVDRRLDGTDLTRRGSPLWLAAGDPPRRVLWTPRVGLNRKAFSFGWHWRVLDAHSPATSRPAARTLGRSRPSPARCPPARG